LTELYCCSVPHSKKLFFFISPTGRLKGFFPSCQWYLMRGFTFPPPLYVLEGAGPMLSSSLFNLKPSCQFMFELPSFFFLVLSGLALYSVFLFPSNVENYWSEILGTPRIMATFWMMSPFARAYLLSFGFFFFFSLARRPLFAHIPNSSF